MKKIMIILSVWSCCLLFTGCSFENPLSLNEDAGTENTMENGLQEMENNLSDIDLPDIEPVVEDDWLNRIGRENENTTAESLSFEIQISEPMVLEIACVTESGKLDMEIEGEDGEKIFCESDIQTESFEVNVTSPGTYKVIIQAKQHTGSFWIEPRE